MELFKRIANLIKSRNVNSHNNIIVQLITVKEKELSIKRKLLSEADWVKLQQFYLQALWIKSIKSSYQELSDNREQYPKFVTALTYNQAAPPDCLDIDNQIHYQYAQDVVFTYTEFLTNQSLYLNCICQPESILPLPKLNISLACIHFARCLHFNKFESQENYTQGNLTLQQFIQNLKAIACELESSSSIYLPLTESEIPSDPVLNKQFYSDYKRQKWREQASKNLNTPS